MRTYANASTMNIDYPDNLVLSGDLNRIKITKNTTATHVQISFNLGVNPFNYKENLYFLTSSVEFSLSDVLKLIYERTPNTDFDTLNSFYFTVKLYNNTSLLDTENLSIEAVFLGARKVFDKSGCVPVYTLFDYDKNIDIQYYYNFFEFPTEVYAVLSLSTPLLGTVQGLQKIDLSAITDKIYSLIFKVKNYMLNNTFQYLSGSNYWTTDSLPLCLSSFGVTVSNKLQFTIPDVSCGDTLDITYNGGTFVEGVQYYVTINVDAVTNPSGNSWSLIVDIGGNQGTTPIITTGSTSTFVTAGPGGVLKLIGYMDADTSGFGTHSFSATSITIADINGTIINVNDECNGVGQKLGLRFLNRFGLWRYYYVVKKNETNSSGGGIPLWFLEDNTTEYSGLYSEQQKSDSQSLTVYREGLTKELINDFKDIIKSDYVHLFDEVNAVWIPIRVNTNSIVEDEKNNLFDVTLNLLLQSNE